MWRRRNEGAIARLLDEVALFKGVITGFDLTAASDAQADGAVQGLRVVDPFLLPSKKRHDLFTSP